MRRIKLSSSPIFSRNPRMLAIPVAIGVAFALVLGGVALAQGVTFTGCLDGRGNLYRVAIADAPVAPCKMGDQQVTWDEEGPAGPVGPAGPPGSGGATVANLELGGLNGAACSSGSDYHTIGVGCPGSQTTGGEFFTAFEVDPADYPSGAAATLWTVMLVNPQDTLCSRLFDVNSGSAVVNSERCSTNATSANQISRGTSSPPLLSGSLYVLQVKHSGSFMGSGALFRAQLVIDWE
jgi:hypothetical protein